MRSKARHICPTEFMQWYTRPAPRRSWAAWWPSPTAPRALASGTRTSSYFTSQWSEVLRPQIPMPRTMLTPRVAVGTMIWTIGPGPPSGPSGSVTRHMTMKKSASMPLDVNHLWPLMTQSSPSRTAEVSRDRGSEPGLWGSVIEKPDSISPSMSGSSHCCFCSSVPYFTRMDWLPQLGATTPKSEAAPSA